MFPPKAVYPRNPRFVTLVFDGEAPNAREVLRTFKNSLGNGYWGAETLDLSHHICLHLYPGGALEGAS
jgi:hypothetical protein